MDPVCDPGCVNGNCTAPNTCTCETGFNGTTCLDPVCDPGCVNGNCTGPNTCTCETGFNGTTCLDPVCDPGCVNGNCTAPNTCTCETGFNGTTCLDPVCDPGCVNGNCTGPNTCTCETGFNGTTCVDPVCDPSCLSPLLCIAPGKCSCPDGFTGPNCDEPKCDPACGENSDCVAPNTCACTGVYVGLNCSQCVGEVNGTMSVVEPTLKRDTLCTYDGSLYNGTDIAFYVEQLGRVVLLEAYYTINELSDKAVLIVGNVSLIDFGGLVMGLRLNLSEPIGLSDYCAERVNDTIEVPELCATTPQLGFSNPECYETVVDVSSFFYYASLSGEVFGWGANSGLNFSVSHAGSFPQGGYGANNVNLEFGVFGNVSFTAISNSADSSFIIGEGLVANMTLEISDNCKSVFPVIVILPSSASGGSPFPFALVFGPLAALFLLPLLLLFKRGREKRAIDEFHKEADLMRSISLNFIPQGPSMESIEGEGFDEEEWEEVLAIPPTVAESEVEEHPDHVITDEKMSEMRNMSDVVVKRTEDPTTLMFGKKKLKVKVVRGQILVRVGGGFVTYNSFVESYRSAETRKRKALVAGTSTMNLGKLRRKSRYNKEGFDVHDEASYAESDPEDVAADEEKSTVSDAGASVGSPEEVHASDVSMEDAADDLEVAAVKTDGADAPIAGGVPDSSSNANLLAAGVKDDDDEPPQKKCCGCCTIM